MTVEPWWVTVNGPNLAQGDFLRDCLVPIMPADFVVPTEGEQAESALFEGYVFDLIVVTQSCDLENRKARLVATCPIHSVVEFEKVNPSLRGNWEQVRRGRYEGLHLLAGVNDPANNRDALVVDFRQIYSLPIEYLEIHAAKQNPRMRLRSPYLEHFSQGFARFFMRVGLPSSIPAYK